MWVCGGSAEGQLGLPPAALTPEADGEEGAGSSPVCTPAPLPGFPKEEAEEAVLVACGDATTLVAVRTTTTTTSSRASQQQQQRAEAQRRVYGWGSTAYRGPPAAQQQPPPHAPGMDRGAAAASSSGMPSFFRPKGKRDELTESEPTECEGLRGLPIKSLSLGRHHTLALTEDGLVYSFGNGPQLGRRATQTDPTPQVIGFFEKRQIQVVHVSAGWDHSLALSREGELWGWGTSLYDQLGFGDSLHVLAPRKIPVLPPGQRGRVTHAAAGLTHSIAVVDGWEVWGWGDNTRQQLGQLDGAKRRPTPVRLYVPQLDADETVTHLDCGAFHSVIATSKGRVWSWGAGDCGQLGARPTTAGGSAVLVAFPREGGTALPAVDKLVCGAYHSFVLSTDGALYGWGQGTDGQLGSGRRHNELTPIRVALADGQRVTDVGAGWGHSVFLTTPTAS